MRKLRWPTTAEQSDYMRMRKSQNIVKCKNSKAESWMLSKLQSTGVSWTRQASWGYRLFDFWSHPIGCVIEVDGPEHNRSYDLYRDEYNFRRSGIVVVRVRNFDEQDADEAVKIVGLLDSWTDRREYLGLNRGDGVRRHLSKLVFESSMLYDYLSKVLEGNKCWDGWIAQVVDQHLSNGSQLRLF